MRMKTETRTNGGMSTKKLVITALFIAISFAGSFVKVFETVAFDSLPGFLAALLLGPLYGAAVGFLGHLFTALTSGFPLSVPLHLVVAAAMGVTMLVFGLVFRKLKNRAALAVNFAVTGVTGVLLNGPVSLACSMGALALMAGKEAAMSLLVLLPALLIASAANVILALILFKALEKPWSKFS